MATEIQNGWILKADTIPALAAMILADAENDNLMVAATLAQTVSDYNTTCADPVNHPDPFGRTTAYLKALATPPYYAVKVYPGGPNTQGGLKKNEKGQVLDTEGQPDPPALCERRERFLLRCVLSHRRWQHLRDDHLRARRRQAGRH